MTLSPASHPITGIIAWNIAKKKPVFSASIEVLVLVVNPLVMDTENESIAKPSAISIVIISIFMHHCQRVLTKTAWGEKNVSES